MIIKQFIDGSYLEYAPGSFDEWCVYMVNKAKNYRKPPRDVDYFCFLRKQADIYGRDRVYQDFVSVYNVTGSEVEESVLVRIAEIAATYGEAALSFEKVFTIMYMGMIAEEKKAHTKLGKRIKRLGVYKLLIDDTTVDEAANFMRGMSWKVIDLMCKERGF